MKKRVCVSGKMTSLLAGHWTWTCGLLSRTWTSSFRKQVLVTNLQTSHILQNLVFQHLLEKMKFELEIASTHIFQRPYVYWIFLINCAVFFILARGHFQFFVF